MTTLRSAAGAIALGTLFVMLSINDAAAQGDRDPKREPLKDRGLADGLECPKCKKMIETPDGIPPNSCPFCQAKFEVTKKDDGTYSVKYNETTENKWKKPLIYGGGAVAVLGLIGLALKYTVFAPKPQKKKKKRRDDDDDDGDRPRKKKRPVAEDDDEDRPKKVKKPRIVEEDED